MMREYLKVANRGKQQTIHSIENADKNPKEISAWINDVAEIHKKKQPPSVSYSKPLPDIDTLMQVM
jgi:intraflagellar transport protein 46